MSRARLVRRYHPIMAEVAVRPLVDTDRDWVAHLIAERWGAEIVVAHGVVYRPAELAGFAAEDGDGGVLGLLTFVLENQACEVVTLDSVAEGRGVGTALLAAAGQVAREHGCSRIWLITTNDNLHALGFYQRRGYELVAVHRGAVAHSRRLKPAIPLVGAGGIPLRDELELELRL